MANIKNVILKKKIGNVIYELLMKTSAAMVYVDDTTTLATKLESMLEDIADSKTKLGSLLGDDAASSISGQIEAAVNEAIAGVNNAEDPDSLAGKIAAIQQTITSITDETTGILATAKSYTDEKIGLSGTEFTNVKSYVDSVKTELNSTIAGAFHFKGTVDYTDLLPTENVNVGDVYQVKYAGNSTDELAEGASPVELNAEFAYNGEEFVELGSIVDLSAYSTTASVTSAINIAKQEAIDAAATDATTKANAVQGKLDEAVSTINTTMATKARFIISAEEPADLTESDVWAQVIE